MRKKYNTTRALDNAPETKKVDSIGKYTNLFKSKVDGLIISKEVLDNQSIYRGGIEAILKSSTNIEDFKDKLGKHNKPDFKKNNKKEQLTSIERDSGISSTKIKTSFNVSKELGEMIKGFNNNLMNVLNKEKAQDMLNQVGLGNRTSDQFYQKNVVGV